jgi:hypothetical protein
MHMSSLPQPHVEKTKNTVHPRREEEIDNGCDNGQMILPIEERAERKSNPNRN